MKLGLVWVEKYPSRHADLLLSQITTKGFKDGLGGGNPDLDAHESGAFDLLFQPPNPAVNNVDIVYFSGHGSFDGPLFEVQNLNNGVASYQEVQLGGASLKIAVFDCCRTLQRPLQWRGAFQGLRWLLGFSEDIPQRATRGAVFAKLLRDSAPKGIGAAWERAAAETGGAGIPAASIQAMERVETIPQDVLPVDGDLPHPVDSQFFVSRVELPDLTVQTPEEDVADRSRVKLFKTQAPGWTGESLTKICRRLGVPESPQEETEDFHRFAGGALDVFRASVSLWWTGSTHRRVLFGEAPGLPSPEEAIARAMEFLEEKDFLPAKIWQVWTTRTQETHAEKSEDGMTKDILAARHVHVTYQLDGLPVMGPGAKTRVSFESSQVDAFHQFWQQPDGYRDVGIINREQAKEHVKNDKAFRNVQPWLELGTPRLCYHAEPARERPGYLIPAWAVPGRVTVPATEYKFVRFVLAVKPEVIAHFPGLEKVDQVFP